MQKLFKDKFFIICSIAVLIFSIIILIFFGKVQGLFVFASFSCGNIISVLLIAHGDKIVILKNRYFPDKKLNKVERSISQCEICQERNCKRHLEAVNSSQILLINPKLDKAVQSFYSKIISSFVQSWFSLLSHDENFVHTLKTNLREATAHLIHRIRKLDAATFITQKICPLVFKHIDYVQSMLNDGVSLNKLPNEYLKRDLPIHPATVNRQSEKDYLRAVAKCLIPKIFHSENFDSKIFFSLIRELLACWVLLPLMDVMSDPGLLNLMIIQMLSKSKITHFDSDVQKVEFLKEFVDNSNLKNIERDSTILTDNNKLYSYMQFLKKKGMVDVLKFYLDVESLNKETNIASINPIKLSQLQQESEKLVKDYENLTKKDKLINLPHETNLNRAQQNVKNLLEGKLRKEFCKTTEYFKLIYGSREIEYLEDSRNPDQNTVAKIRSKIKGALKTLDGEVAQEIPTVWDAFALEPSSNITSANSNIYNSVTQKLRRERGQNLDAFLLTFIQSLEQETDVGIEVNCEPPKPKREKSYSFETTLLFGDLFGLSKFSKKFQRSFYVSFEIIGASRSLLYLAYKLLKIKTFFVKLLFSLTSLWQDGIDNIICNTINKLISLGLYQPRLAILITLLEEHLFEEKHSDISSAELLDRKNFAKSLLTKYNSGLGDILEVLQCPVLNKHLMYCVFDAVLSELYVEFRT